MRAKISRFKRSRQTWTEVGGSQRCALNVPRLWNFIVTYNGIGQHVNRPNTSSKCTYRCKIVFSCLLRNSSALRFRAPSVRSRKLCNSTAWAPWKWPHHRFHYFREKLHAWCMNLSRMAWTRYWTKRNESGGVRKVLKCKKYIYPRPAANGARVAMREAPKVTYFTVF